MNNCRRFGCGDLRGIPEFEFPPQHPHAFEEVWTTSWIFDDRCQFFLEWLSIAHSWLRAQLGERLMMELERVQSIAIDLDSIDPNREWQWHVRKCQYWFHQVDLIEVD